MVASVHSANLHYKVEKQQDRIERGSYNVKLIPSTFCGGQISAAVCLNSS